MPSGARCPDEFGPWPTVYGRFRVWRDAGVFTALLEGLIAEAARQGKTDLSLVSVNSTTARTLHDAAGMRVDPEVMEALEEAVREQEQTRQKGAPARNEADRMPETTPAGKEQRRVRRRRKARLKQALRSPPG